MRISDWSSDVCSSDLAEESGPRRNIACVPLNLSRRLRRRLAKRRRFSGALRSSSLAATACAATTPLEMTDDYIMNIIYSKALRQYAFLLGKIGRASCRERVGQYV